MIVPFATRWIATWTADIRALWKSWGSRRGGWRGAWHDTTELARHRQIVIQTFHDAERVLLTRIRLSGETETCVRRSWLHGKGSGDVDETIKEHFKAVAAAAAGWPTALGMVRLGSRIAGVGGLVLAARQVTQVIRELLSGGPQALLHTASTNWPLLAWLAVLLIGVIARPILRWWLGAMVRRVPLGVPAQS